MKILIAVALALALAGCQCGPGVPCTNDEPCAPWGVCGTGGFCIARVVNGDGGVPRAVVPTTNVDLANVGCGSMKAQKITITNAGSGTLSFTTTLVNGTIFSVTPTMGDLTAGQTAELTVTGQVPDSTVANTELVGVLTLNINEEGRSKIDLPLKLKSLGVTLTVMPAVLAFSPSQIGDAPQTLPVTLKNTGNSPATLTFSQPTDDQFALTWMDMDGGTTLTLAAGATLPGLEASFKAKRITPATTFVPISVAEPVCGSSVAVIPMSGRGQNGIIELSDTELLFGNAGRVDCGSTAAPKTFTIRNVGNAAFSWSGSLSKGATSPFTVAPLSGILNGNADAGVTITVTPNPLPANASTMANGFSDSFAIATSIAGDMGRAVELRQTANGAVISFSSPTVEFGLVPLGETASAPISILNDGNTVVSVSFSSNNTKFALTPAGPLPLDGGTTSALTATFKPDASVPETGEIALSITDGGVLCAPLPPALAVNGSGSTGSVSYTPVGLDFGTVSCGTTAMAQTVTFKNAGNQSYTITSIEVGDGGSPFTVSMLPVNGVVVSDGGTLVITVQPKPIPQTASVTVNGFGDTLTVTTDVLGDLPHLIALRQTARGAIFGISTSAINFGSIAVGGLGTSQFTIDNSGNAPGTINFAPGFPTIYTLPRDAGVAANSSFQATAIFSPQTTGPASDSANITVSPTTVLCQPLPFTAMSLDGVGTSGNALSLSVPSLTFGSAGLVPCNTTAMPKSIVVTNTSAYTVALTLTLGINDGGSPYTVAGPASLGPGDAGTVTVTPKLMPAVASTAPDFYADNLSIRAFGPPVNETQVVALHQTAQGAKLTFFPGALQFNGSLGQNPTKTFTVNNVGNLTAPYTLTIGGNNPNPFSVTPTSSSVNPGAGVTETVKYTGELLTPKRTAIISITPGAPLCAPIPAPVQLQAN